VLRAIAAALFRIPLSKDEGTQSQNPGYHQQLGTPVFALRARAIACGIFYLKFIN
jgi:hypothetical protein